MLERIGDVTKAVDAPAGIEMLEMDFLRFDDVFAGGAHDGIERSEGDHQAALGDDRRGYSAPAVLRLLARGKSNREIGDLLGISPRTVQNHVAHIYDKVGV